MIEFKCCKCLHYKKPELLSHYEKSKQGKRAVCSHCAGRINEAAKQYGLITENELK